MPVECSQPLYEMIVDRTFEWILCPHAIQGPGVSGVGLMIWFTGFVMMANWSEGFKMPVAWTMLFAPILFATLPGMVVQKLLGLATLGVAASLFFLWNYWRDR